MTGPVSPTRWLVALVVVAFALALWIEPQRRQTPAELARGPRAMRIVPGDVERVEVRRGPERVEATRAPIGWTIDGRAAPPMKAQAVDDLVQLLSTVRAVDAFRAEDLATFGLEPPSATIVVTTGAGERRLAIGVLNTTGATVYARCDDHPRVLRLGVYLLSVVERVLAPSGGATGDGGV
jgi:hypothetical protein